MKHIDSKLHVYLNHRADLVDYVATITGCRARAEDVVQDAYLRFVPENGSPSTQGTSGPAYLYRIVRNLAFDLCRRSTLEHRHQNQGSVEWLEPPAESSPEQTLIQRNRLEALSTVLKDLPKRERIALEMHRIGGHTLAEISERLDVSTATAHRLVRNALVKLAASIEEPVS